ncbi:MAG: folylpolyglutamate synthase/dihydrofolate synthase family protein [Chloroflexota bacterium]|nr:folylpolyglutamate synthase/dihydrofolate synthase family protein [Chloroflexota bacterium]
MNNIEPQYQQALDYIYSFVDYSRTRQANLSPENFDLARMREFATALGNPQDNFKTIHVAGSKGKGSTSAFCAAALQEAGYRVGLYTSPHLKDFEERMQINREPIPRAYLVELVEEIKPHVAAIPQLTTFEITTGLGFLYFARQKVDAAVIEVGLGGRLDATNIITPNVSVITALYLDHTSILGDSLEEIAAEKAGIVKPGVPVVLAPQKAEACRVVGEIAKRRASHLTQVGVNYVYERQSASLAGQTFHIAETHARLSENPTELSMRLLGEFQIENAATAYAALRVANENGIAISEEAIQKGFAKTAWAARFEVIQENPPVILDSAHNPAAITKLRQAVKEFFGEKPIILVFGISEDKKLSGMFANILPYAKKIICAQAAHPRAMNAEELMEAARPFGIPAEAIPNVGDALWKAIQIAGDEALVLVTGSIFVAASARIAWQEKFSEE